MENNINISDEEITKIVVNAIRDFADILNKSVSEMIIGDIKPIAQFEKLGENNVV